MAAKTLPCATSNSLYRKGFNMNTRTDQRGHRKDDAAAHNVLLAIQRVMSGQQWSTDTLETVRSVMELAGYAIADPADGHPEDDQGRGHSPDLISSEQASTWAGRHLSAEDLQRLDACIPNSSIPEAIGDIVGGWH